MSTSPVGKRSRAHEERIERYLTRTGRPPFRAPGNCLDRSLAAYRLLSAAGAEPEVVIGVKRRETNVDGHVWVRVDGGAIPDGGANVQDFTEIAVYDRRGRRSSDTGTTERFAIATLK
jgi:hypothetical protein